MREYTDTFMRAEAGSGALIDPAAADQIAVTSRLLTEIGRYEASLVAGPLRTDRQHWVSVAEHGVPSDAASTRPRAGRFVAPSAATDQTAAIQPRDIGLYTSTATAERRSMWREYLELYRGSTLYPLPWYTWEVRLRGRGARVAEVVSAAKWVEFVEAYARISDGLIYPDWESVASDFDAVHMTLPAIVAAQGFHFRTPQGIIPPAFWDVETTFWLRWCFSDAYLVETVDPGVGQV
jgi:hypothetical protein